MGHSFTIKLAQKYTLANALNDVYMPAITQLLRKPTSSHIMLNPDCNHQQTAAA